MVIVISSAIGGFSRVDLVWLAASTVRLQVSDYSQLSDYNCTEWLVKSEAADAPITFEDSKPTYTLPCCTTLDVEIVIVIII